MAARALHPTDLLNTLIEQTVSLTHSPCTLMSGHRPRLPSGSDTRHLSSLHAGTVVKVTCCCYPAKETQSIPFKKLASLLSTHTGPSSPVAARTLHRSMQRRRLRRAASGSPHAGSRRWRAERPLSLGLVQLPGYVSRSSSTLGYVCVGPVPLPGRLSSGRMPRRSVPSCQGRGP